MAIAIKRGGPKMGFNEMSYKDASKLYGDKDWVIIPVAGGCNIRPRDMTHYPCPRYQRTIQLIKERLGMAKVTKKTSFAEEAEQKAKVAEKSKVLKKPAFQMEPEEDEVSEVPVKGKKKSAKAEEVIDKPTKTKPGKSSTSAKEVEKPAKSSKPSKSDDGEKLQPYSKRALSILREGKKSLEEIAEEIDSDYQHLKKVGAGVIDYYRMKHNERNPDDYLPKLERNPKGKLFDADENAPVKAEPVSTPKKASKKK